MKRTDSKKKLHPLFTSFSGRRIVLVSILMIVLATASISIPSPNTEAKRMHLPLRDSIKPTVIEQRDKVEVVKHQSELSWKTITIKHGDSLSNIFKRTKLSRQELYKLTNSSSEAKILTRIFPGQTLHFKIGENKELKALRYTKSPLESTLFEKTENGEYVARQIVRTPETRTKFRSARINKSLFLAGHQAGLPQRLIMEMANIFGGVIDFVNDPRKGDQFYVLYEEKYLDGEKIGIGEILAAQYINQGEKYTAFRYEYENGDVGYYTPEGISMRKTFLRAPLDFTRISSGFSLRRKHPIHKNILAHRGVDYTAPRGTPVFAAGDGRVVSAGYSKANGNYVFIEHGQQYMTKYLHLHKRHVKRGQKVKQRQIIGTVGSTGYSTGPHLHYEFLVNGVHRNPRTILKKLPKAESIAENEKQRFIAHIHDLQLQFINYTRATQLAMLDATTIIQSPYPKKN